MIDTSGSYSLDIDNNISFNNLHNSDDDDEIFEL